MDAPFIKTSLDVFRAYRRGYRDVDLEWYLIGGSAELAVFATGLQLIVPQRILEDEEAYVAVLRYVLDLPVIGASVPNNPAAMFDYGARGVYGYDVPSDAVSQTVYERSFIPAAVHHVDRALWAEAGAPLHALASNIEFQRDLIVDVGRVWTCV